MKINSGDYKYRKLEIPEDIRPTTEKVREAVFSMLAFDIPGAVVLDLFGGSGSLGLEALSRGASKCIFNDASRNNFNIMKGNIEHCGALEKSELYNHDFRKCLTSVKDKLDVVFIDPPYKEGYNDGWYSETMHLLQDCGLIDDESVVVAEHLYKYKLDDQYGSLKKFKEKKYGSIGVDLYSL